MTLERPIQVLAMPMFDPACARIDVELPAGLTIIEIVRRVLPRASLQELARCRVIAITDRGSSVIDPSLWAVARPRPGVRIVVRMVPGKGALSGLLQIVVAIAAVALGQFWAVPILGLSAGTVGAAISLGISIAGNLLINALIPPPKSPSVEAGKPTYAISGWKNTLSPDAPVPLVLGGHRYAAPFAAYSYSEIVGDLQYIRALFVFGYGRLDLSDFRIGDTPIGTYTDVEMEVREGVAGELPVSLYPRQVIEQLIGVDLIRPYPVDDLGEIIDGSEPVETPVSRFTGSDASGFSVVLQFPGGLFQIYPKSGNRGPIGVTIRVRRRLNGVGAWTTVKTLSIKTERGEGFFRQFTSNLPTRGRWEIEVTRMSIDHTFNSRIQSRVAWAGLQTLRPEYPINVHKPLALVAVRIRATYQLQGQLDSFNALARSYCLDWDHATGTWVYRVSANPAALYRHALQCAANARPEPDSRIDLAQLQDWHDFCRLRGLEYRRVHDFDSSLKETLDAICAAGRATPRHDGIKWGVVIDNPRSLVLVDEINPRNSDQFKVARTYFEPPHAFRVSFLDASNDFQSAERIVPWPGYDGDITLTEQVDFPGVTDPDQIWLSARRRMYELIHRPDNYMAIQDGVARVATRGDGVIGSFDTLVRTDVATRVKTVRDNLVELDERVTMQAGSTYAIRFRRFADAEDTIGVSFVRTIATLPGEHTVVRLTGAGQAPLAGSIVHFGRSTTPTMRLIVAGVENGEDMSSVFRMLDAAPIIDELLDADDPPAWSGRVGAEIDDSLLVPAVPRISSVKTGATGTGETNGLFVRIVPGTGTAAVADSYDLQHRIAGATPWATIDIPVADGGADVPGYVKGNTVELQARALTSSGVPSEYTAIVTATIGAGDAAIPAALPAGIDVEGGRGSATIRFATSSNAATMQVQIYRTVAGVALNRATDAIDDPFDVARSTTITKVDGDATRPNLLSQADFATIGAWSTDTGWTVSGGMANHVSGSAGSISQAETSFANGKWYRVAFTVSGASAGDVLPRLSGGSNRDGTARSANGRYYDRIQAVTGNNSFAFYASATFAGSIPDVTLYLEGPESVSQGDYDYYLEPQNEDGVPGPVSGPFAATII